jgi:hypothetical protein
MYCYYVSVLVERVYYLSINYSSLTLLKKLRNLKEAKC